VTFVDETSDIANNYDGDSPVIITLQFEDRNTDQSVSSDTPSQFEPGPRAHSIETGSASFSSSSSRTISSTKAINFPQSLYPSVPTQPLPSYHQPLSIDELIDQRTTRSAYRHGHQTYSQGHSNSNLTIPPVYSDTSIWPLTDPSEALLLRHFVQNLATWVRSAN
jgi:hypothetical protein